MKVVKNRYNDDDSSDNIFYNYLLSVRIESVRVGDGVLVITTDARVTGEAVTHAGVEVTQTTLGARIQFRDILPNEHLADVTVTRVPHTVKLEVLHRDEVQGIRNCDLVGSVVDA